MAMRYSEEVLLHLRLSPLCVRPTNLPPAEDWMGLPPDTIRNATRPGADSNRTRTQDSPLADYTNRRPDSNRHSSRNGANPDDIILGPPRTNFASAFSRSSFKLGDVDKVSSRDQEPRDRFNFRNRNGEIDASGDRGADRFRDGRSNLRRRDDRDQDSDGWSTVKPRKSFGHEGAERFQNGRGGVFRADQPRDDRKLRDKDESDSTRDRQRRPFDNHARDRDTDEGDPRWNLTRGRSEPWYRDNGHDDRDRGDRQDRERPSQRERIDRAKSWREREPEDHRDRNERHSDRRFDSRAERDPEWMDEPATGKADGHTEEDFKKFMESMKAGHAGAKKPEAAQPVPAESRAPKDDSPPGAEPGLTTSHEDKFFSKFTANTEAKPEKTEDAAKRDSLQSAAAKSSRFTSFFSAPQPQAEASVPPHVEAAAAPAPAPTAHAAVGLAAFFGASLESGANGQTGTNEQENKQAFAALLQKLQLQTLSSPSPVSSPSAPPAPSPENDALHQQQQQQQQQQQSTHRPQQPLQPSQLHGQIQFHQQPQPQQPVQQAQQQHLRSQQQQSPLYQQQQQHQQHQQQHQHQPQHQPQPQPQPQQQHHLHNPMLDGRPKNNVMSPEHFQQYGPERRAPQPQQLQEILAGRGMQPTQIPTSRPEQVIQDLLEQRHQAQSQGSGRGDSAPANPQTDFLMRLMHQQPEPRRTEELLMKMPQPQKQTVNLPMMAERELEFQRERQANPSQRPMRPQGPPGLFEDQFHRPDVDGRPSQPHVQGRQSHSQPQPTQILQRPPPGLDHHQMHTGFLAGGAQAPPFGQQQRGPMIPPPGLPGGGLGVPGGPLGGPGGPMGPASPNRHMHGMFPPNFPHGSFPPPEAMAGPRMQPPPGLYGGLPPPGHPGFPHPGPPGLGAFQGGPEGMPFGGHFDGRGMPPPGAGGQFRRP